MRNQWSILLHGTRKGKWSIVRRRDDDPSAAGGGSPTPDPVAAPTPDPVDDPAASPDPSASQPDPTEAMWGDLTPDPAPDPAAPAEIPAEYTRALSISDYVKEPAHLERAVQAAQEMWDVQTGREPVTKLLEGFRATNPQQFEKMMTEQLIPFVEQMSGKKLGDATAPDPMAEMQAEIQRLKDQPRIEAEQRQHTETISRAEQAGGKHIDTLIAAGNGIFEGDLQAAVSAVAAQYQKLGLDPNKVMKEVLSGDMKNLEKAYKAAEKAETLRVKAYSDRIRAKFTKLKNTVPKTGSSQTDMPGSDKPDLTTQAGRARWMAAEYAAGRGGDAA